MANLFNAKCPKCGSEDHIKIACTLWLTLGEDGTSDEGQDHEYGPDNEAHCTSCDYYGKFSEFDT